MSGDLISRSALLEEFGEEPFVWDSRDREEVQMHNDWLDYTKLVKEAPAVDAEPVRHGRWISEKCNHKPYRIKNPEKWVIYKCSECGYSNGRKQSNYCPHCGAKMDGEAHE